MRSAMDALDSFPPGYRTQSEDTEPWAERLQFERWRSMSLAEKAQLVRELCIAQHELHLVGIALRHPEADREELELRAACQRLGRATVERALGRRLPFED